MRYIHDVENTESSESSGTKFDEEKIHAAAERSCSEVTHRTCGLRQEQQLLAAGRQEPQFKRQGCYDGDEEGKKRFLGGNNK